MWFVSHLALNITPYPILLQPYLICVRKPLPIIQIYLKMLKVWYRYPQNFSNAWFPNNEIQIQIVVS